MKYKLIAVFSILFLILGCVYVDVFYKKELSYVYHQHLEDSSDDSGCEGKDNCSHLPIVNIKTYNQEIPVKNQDNSVDIVDYIISDVEIYDNGDEVNYLGEEGGVTWNARVRYRGRSSIDFDKKGYLLKFVNKNNEKVNKSFLGMPSDSEWVLHGPFIDKTLIRNYMWYNIGQEIMGSAPKTRFLELYVDDDYHGLYLAVESVTQSEISRVKMESIRNDSIATSYLIQLDSDFGTPVTNLNSYSKYTYELKSANRSRYLTIKYPSEVELTEDVKKYIYDDFSKFEKMLYSFDYKEYKDYIDVDSFVDYFIINEFTQNYDAGWLSTYIYKDVSGKYKMYMWDFNSANNNYKDDYLIDGYQRFEFDKIIWYEMMIKDPEFVEAIIKRYEELRKTYLSEEYLFTYIDETIFYLDDAVDRNFSVWGYTFDSNYDAFITNFMPSSYDEAIIQLKEAIHSRGMWMDENIYTLRQYSHESKNKKYNNKR